MFIRALCRCSVVLVLMGLMTACSIGGSDSSSSASRSFFNECTFSFGGCMYDGPYEPGEEQYAEEEARRLNRAQLERLRQLSL